MFMIMRTMQSRSAHRARHDHVRRTATNLYHAMRTTPLKQFLLFDEGSEYS
jgi:hypothetical protein